MSLDWYNATFMGEILVAEFLFLYACPKRSKFWLRYLCCIAWCFLLALIFPLSSHSAFEFITDMKWSRAVTQFVRFMAMFALSAVGMCICFDMNVFCTVSLCTMGYALQHISFHALTVFNYFLKKFAGKTSLFESTQLNEIIACVIVFAIAWLIFGRQVAKREYYKHFNTQTSIISTIIIVICLGIMRLARSEGVIGNLSTSFYAITCCVLAIIMEFSAYRISVLNTENAIIRHMRENDKLQYEIAKSTIETVNIKCHDLKHIIYSGEGNLSTEEKKFINDTILIYDNNIKTGNGVLDVVLMDNSLRYGAQGVKFTFMGKGEYLDFVSETDLASLLGNAIGNASEAAVNVVPEKRTVSVTLEKSGNMITFVVQNYFSGELKTLDGYPVTTKNNTAEHGFGIKSMIRTAEKYGGNVRYSTDGDIFTLTIYIIDKH